MIETKKKISRYNIKEILFLSRRPDLAYTLWV